MGDDLRLGVAFDVGGDASAAELDDLTAALRPELLELDVARVDRVPGGPAPEGSRGVDLAAIGALVVTASKATPILGQIVAVLQAWSARNPNRTAELSLDGDTLKVGGLSEQEQNGLIEEWLARHSPAPTAPSTPAAPGPTAHEIQGGDARASGVE